MFSGSFGVRSIVLCKCSGKYIDIYFKLKITCGELFTANVVLLIWHLYFLFFIDDSDQLLTKTQNRILKLIWRLKFN